MPATVCHFLCRSSIAFLRDARNGLPFVCRSGIAFRGMPATVCHFLSRSGIAFLRDVRNVCHFWHRPGIDFLRNGHNSLPFLCRSGIALLRDPRNDLPVFVSVRHRLFEGCPQQFERCPQWLACNGGVECVRKRSTNQALRIFTHCLYVAWPAGMPKKCS